MLRSEDNSAWWKDGGGNFTIPIPSSKEEEAATGGPAHPPGLRYVMLSWLFFQIVWCCT